MPLRPPAGFIPPGSNPTPTGPFEDGSASGVWNLSSQLQAIAQSIWPLAGNAAPIGIWGGGADGFLVAANVQQLNIATLGNTTVFGELSFNRGRLAGCSSSTRGLFLGGGAG